MEQLARAFYQMRARPFYHSWAKTTHFWDIGFVFVGTCPKRINTMKTNIITSAAPDTPCETPAPVEGAKDVLAMNGARD